MISTFLKSKWIYSIIVSIFLILLCIPPFSFWWLSFFVLVPVFITIDQQTYKNTFFSGVLFGFLFYLGIFHWVIPSVTFVAGIHWFFSSLLCLSVFLLIGLAYGCLFLLIKFSLTHWLFTTPLLLPAFEFLVLPVFPIGIGYVWGDSLLGAQIADIGGIYFLSFITSLYSLFLFLIIQKKISRQKGFLLFTLLAVVHFGYGTVRYITISNTTSNESIKIMIVQPAIPAVQKRDLTKKTYDDVMVQLSNALNQNKDVDLIVLPESIFVPFMKDNDPRLEALKTLLNPKQAICWGCNTIKTSASNEVQFFNSIGFLDNSINAKWKFYQKQKLLLIGEYIPFLDRYPDLKKSIEKATHINQFSPGEKLVSFEKKSFEILPSICFENMFSVLMAKKLKQMNGADILLNISEDGWFGNTNAQPIHYFVTKLRAIEFRRPLIRSLNIGISAIVDERGVEISKVKNSSDESSTAAKSSSFVKCIVIGEIKKRSSFSFYGSIGYIFPYFCSLVFLFILSQGIRSFNNRTKKED